MNGKKSKSGQFCLSSNVNLSLPQITVTYLFFVVISRIKGRQKRDMLGGAVLCRTGGTLDWLEGHCFHKGKFCLPSNVNLSSTKNNSYLFTFMIPIYLTFTLQNV